jgi:hypothetical protein
MVRAVRDARFKYIRNCHPELPYNIWVPYLNRHPIMQEMWKLHLKGELKGPQKLMFQDSRPVEELYDTRKDPWEISNLAGNPKYSKEKKRLSKALDAWMDEIGDLGKLDESAMVGKWYPGGVQPLTAAPVFVPICASSPGVVPARGGECLKAPVMLQLYCATQGASIGYSLDSGASPKWNLYTGPIRLPAGKVTIRAKAIRIGYRESAEKKAVLKIKP